MKKILSILVACGILSTMAACNATGTQSSASASNGASQPAATAAPTVAPASSLSMDDIAWSIQDRIIWDTPTLSLDYTNNTEYTLVDLEITFNLKPDVTPEQLAVFGEEEDVAETYILGYNRRFCDPGETVTDSPCVLNGARNPVKSREQFDLTEPTSAQIVYIGADNKMHNASYNFKTKTMAESGKSLDLYEWADSEISKMIPKPEFKVVHLGSNSEDFLGFTFYDCQPEQLQAYAKACEEKGFNKEINSGDTYFNAKHADGYEVRFQYNDIEETIFGRVEVDDDAMSSAASAASSQGA